MGPTSDLPHPPAPLILLVGYLGAGKTTFLQRIIPALAARGIRPRVVLNDYEDARVDAARLAALDVLVTPIDGDCICCGSREELLETLRSLQPDAASAVLVEANGTSDATELHDVLALDPGLTALTRPMQVTVIDARRWQKRWFDKALEKEQAVTASHFWVNWADEVSPQRHGEVMRSLGAVSARARHTTPDDLAEEVAALLGEAPPYGTRVVGRSASHTSTHTHDVSRHHFASLGVEFPPLVPRRALEDLVQEFAPWLRRAKGVITLAESPSKQHAWNYLAGERALRFEALPIGGFSPVAVFIGAELPSDRIEARVRALRGDGACDRDAHG